MEDAMRVFRADSSAEVAKLLRALADLVEQTVPGVGAVAEIPGKGDGVEAVLELRLRPTVHKWNLTELESALSHPGD